MAVSSEGALGFGWVSYPRKQKTNRVEVIIQKKAWCSVKPRSASCTNSIVVYQTQMICFNKKLGQLVYLSVLTSLNNNNNNNSNSNNNKKKNKIPPYYSCELHFLYVFM